jgi:rare lipoprotein A
MRAVVLGVVSALTLSYSAFADQYGVATYYYHPRYPFSLIAAHKTLPLGSRVRVHDLDNGRSVDVTIVDRGPFAGPERIIDLSTVAAGALGIRSVGVAHVRVERLAPALETAYRSYRAAAVGHRT